MRKTLCKPGKLVRSLKFEHLEDRAMMAGNVCCACTNGNLCISGDKCDNSICVQQCSDGRIEVRGLNGTKINGCDCFTCCNVCAIKCDMKDGCDNVKMSDCCVRQCICVCGGNGNDCVQLCNCEAAGLGINGANGADDVRLSCCQICCDKSCSGKKDCNGCTQGSICCDTGSGCDNVLVERCCGTCDIQCKTGADKDCCVITKCEVTRGISIDSGAGADNCCIHSCKCDTCQVKCEKSCHVCCDGDTCRSSSCSKCCQAQAADVVHTLSLCRDWSDWDCDTVDLAV